MTISTEVEYQGQISLDIDTILSDIINASLDYEGCPFECELSVLITDDEAIQELNSQFRDIDRSTDVLSFPMIDYAAPGDFSGLEEDETLFDPDTGELVLGDIVISMDHVKAQAELYGHSEKRELAFLVAHSMLHLMGYDHMDDTEREDMERRQEAILTGAGYTRDMA